uniref:G-protein coupled receptors family 1 profile domain-containing protein n=1 Tax=Panagrolaimus sp. JU765 TaxID=591449 RepID=A0AC34Q0F4_9BILA
MPNDTISLAIFPDEFLDDVSDEEHCIHVSEAIRAQGIDDWTSWFIVKFGFTIVYTTLFVLGIVGNGGVLVAVAHNKRLRSARNIFLLNLIVTDLLLCLTGIPVTPWYALHKEWVFGSLMCRLMPLSNSCAVFVSSWSLTAIAADKYIHITNPTKEPFSIRFAGIVTILIWLICSLINIPYLLSYELVDGAYYVSPNSTPFCGKFCDEINWHGESNRRIYGAAVHRDMIIQNVQFCQSLSSSQRVDAVNRKKRVNYILIGMVLAFIGCWSPLTAVNVVKDFKVEPDFIKFQPYFWPLVAHVIAMSTVIWNPLLFFWLTRKQKRSKLGGILHTSEIITSLASRVQSFRSTSGNESRTGSIKQKRSKLGGILHTSEIITSLASRVQSFRSTSGNESRTGSMFKKRHLTIDSENTSFLSNQNRSSIKNGHQIKSSNGVMSGTGNSPRSSIQSNGTSVTRPLVVSTSPEYSSASANHPTIQKTCSLKNDLLNML